jgi:tetratricopeptide (TPR) repeat protein
MILQRFILRLIKCARSFILLAPLSFCVNETQGQRQSFEPCERTLMIDTLLLLVKNTNQDSIKVKALNDLASNKYMISLQNAIADYEPAIKYANDALLLAQKINDKKQQGVSIEIIALVFKQKGDFPEALKRFFIVLKLSEKIGDTEGAAEQYYQIANIYFELGNFSEALKYHLISLKMKEKIGWESNLQLSYNCTGNTYYKGGNLDEAIKYFLLAIKTANERDDKGQIAVGYKGLGNVYMDKLNYPEALKHFFAAIKIMEHGGENYLPDCYFGIGNVYLKKATSVSILKTKESYLEALHYFKKGLLVAERAANKKSVIAGYSGLAQAYQGINDFKNALHYTLLYSQLKDSLFNNLSYSKAAELKMQYENEKATALEKVNQEKINADKRQKNSLLMLGGGAFTIVFIFFGLLFRQRNLKRRAVEKAETTHQLAEFEMQSLRSQLNPHFMFNSLNSIQTLILKEDTDRSQSYLSRFARLLRMLLENADAPFIPLRKEIDFLQLYLSLESLRVPDLQYSISTDPALNTEQTLIPNMFLQPYVENAIWHGLSHKETDKKLQIRISWENGIVNYEIEDNGVGRKKSEELKSLFRKQHQSKGMELLNKRINLLNTEYGSTIQTEISDVIRNNEVAGTLVTIKIPVKLSEPLLN